MVERGMLYYPRRPCTWGSTRTKIAGCVEYFWFS